MAGNPFDDLIPRPGSVPKVLDGTDDPALLAVPPAGTRMTNPMVGTLVAEPVGVPQVAASPPTPVAGGFDDPQQYIEGVKGIVPGAIKAAGTTLQAPDVYAASAQQGAAQRVRERLDILDRADRGEQIDPRLDVAGYGQMTPEQRANARAGLSRVLGQEWVTNPTPIQDRTLFKAGEAIQDFAKTVLPAAPGYEKAFGREVGEGGGSLLFGLPFAFLGTLPAAAVYGSMGVGEATQRAVEFDRKEKTAGRQGLTQDQITTAGLLGIGPGMTDVAPVEVLLGRLPIRVPEVLRRPLAQGIARIGIQATIEGIQEGGQGFLQDLIAREVYNPSQVLGENFERETQVGGAVGGIAEFLRQLGTGMVRSAAGRRGAGQSTTTQPAPEASPLPQDHGGPQLPWPTPAIPESPPAATPEASARPSRGRRTREAAPPAAVPANPFADLVPGNTAGSIENAPWVAELAQSIADGRRSREPDMEADTSRGRGYGDGEILAAIQSAPSRIEWEAREILKDARDLETQMQREGASPKQIADAFNQRYGAAVTADQVESGNVWWRYLPGEKAATNSADRTNLTSVIPEFAIESKIAESQASDNVVAPIDLNARPAESAQMRGVAASSVAASPGPRMTPELRDMAIAMADQGLAAKTIADRLTKQFGTYVRPALVEQAVSYARGVAMVELRAQKAAERRLAFHRSPEQSAIRAARMRETIARPEMQEWLRQRGQAMAAAVGTEGLRQRGQALAASQGKTLWTPEMVERLGAPATRAMQADRVAQQFNADFGTAFTANSIRQKRSELGYGYDGKKRGVDPKKFSWSSDSDAALVAAMKSAPNFAERAKILNEQFGASLTPNAIQKRWEKIREASLKAQGDEPMFATGGWSPRDWLDWVKGNKDADAAGTSQTGRSQPQAGRILPGQQSGTDRARSQGNEVHVDGGRRGISATFRVRGLTGRILESDPNAQGLRQRFVFLHPDKAWNPDAALDRPTLKLLQQVPNWTAKAHISETPNGGWVLKGIAVRKNKQRGGLGAELIGAIEQQIGSELSPPDMMTQALHGMWSKRSPEDLQDYRQFRGKWYSPERLRDMRDGANEYAQLLDTPIERNVAAKKFRELDELVRSLPPDDVSDDVLAAVNNTPPARNQRAFALEGVTKFKRPVSIPKNVVDGVRRALGPLLPMVPPDTNVGVLTRIAPVKSSNPKVNTEITFETTSGDTFGIRGDAHNLLAMRALFDPNTNSIGILRFDISGDVGEMLSRIDRGEVGDVVVGQRGSAKMAAPSLRGEIGHEVVHALRFNDLIDARDWARLVVHGNALRVMDSEYRTLLQRIGNANYTIMAPGVTGRDIYNAIYRGQRPEVQTERMNQETVAHLIELYTHNELLPQESESVRDLLDAILDGSIWRVPQDTQAQPSQLSLGLGEGANDNSTLAAIQRNRLRDQDSLGYYSHALEAARSLKQAKGTPEQMLAQLRSAGVKQAEIEATGLDKLFDERTKNVVKAEPIPGVKIETYKSGDIDMVRARSDHGEVSAFVHSDRVQASLSGLKSASLFGKGYGRDLYQSIVDWSHGRNLPFDSDTAVEASAARVYRSLSRRGYDVDEMYVGGDPVFRVWPSSGKGIVPAKVMEIKEQIANAVRNAESTLDEIAARYGVNLSQSDTLLGRALAAGAAARGAASRDRGIILNQLPRERDTKEQANRDIEILRHLFDDLRQLTRLLKAARVDAGHKTSVSKPLITRDEIVAHLEANRVGLRESVYSDEQKELADRAKNLWRQLQHAREGVQYTRGETQEKARADVARLQPLYDAANATAKASIEATNRPRWKNHSLDPSNPTYRETVIHLPRKPDQNARIEEINKRLRAGNLTAAEMTALADERSQIWETSGGVTRDQNFTAGHFPEPNIVGHMMTSMTKHEGQPVYTIDQIQSDWGQKLRDGGVQDEAKIAELEAVLKAKYAEHNPKIEAWKAFWDTLGDRARGMGGADGWLPNQPENGLASFMTGTENWYNRNSHLLTDTMKAEFKRRIMDIEYARRDLQMPEAELATAKAATPGNPLVNTTDQWTTTTLRRAIRQAVEAGAEYMAIPHGDTVLSYNPGDTDGMRGFYGSRTSEGIVPKNLRKLLERMDKTIRPVRVEKLETSQGLQGWQGDKGEYTAPNEWASVDVKKPIDPKQTGFTLFPLTDKVKAEVMEEGQPMFAFGGERSSPDDMLARYQAEEQRLRDAGLPESKINAQLATFWNKLSRDNPNAYHLVAESALYGDTPVDENALQHMMDVASAPEGSLRSRERQSARISALRIAAPSRYDLIETRPMPNKKFKWTHEHYDAIDAAIRNGARTSSEVAEQLARQFPKDGSVNQFQVSGAIQRMLSNRAKVGEIMAERELSAPEEISDASVRRLTESQSRNRMIRGALRDLTETGEKFSSRTAIADAVSEMTGLDVSADDITNVAKDGSVRPGVSTTTMDGYRLNQEARGALVAIVESHPSDAPFTVPVIGRQLRDAGHQISDAVLYKSPDVKDAIETVRQRLGRKNARGKASDEIDRRLATDLIAASAHEAASRLRADGHTGVTEGLVEKYRTRLIRDGRITPRRFAWTPEASQVALISKAADAAEQLGTTIAAVHNRRAWLKRIPINQAAQLLGVTQPEAKRLINAPWEMEMERRRTGQRADGGRVPEYPVDMSALDGALKIIRRAKND